VGQVSDVGVRKNLLTRDDYRAVSFTQELSQRRRRRRRPRQTADRQPREIKVIKDAWNSKASEIFRPKSFTRSGTVDFWRICAARRRLSCADRPLAQAVVSCSDVFGNCQGAFHVHPPSIPENNDAVDWLRRLYIDEPDNYSVRSYDKEHMGRDVFLFRAASK